MTSSSTTRVPSSSSSSNSYKQIDEFQIDFNVEVATNNSKLDNSNKGKKLNDKKPDCTPVKYVDKNLNVEDQYEQPPTLLSQVQSHQQQLNQEEYINFETSYPLQDNSYVQSSSLENNNNFPDLYYTDDNDEEMYKNDIEQEVENINNRQILVKRKVDNKKIDDIDIDYVSLDLSKSDDDYSDCDYDSIKDDYTNFFFENYDYEITTPANRRKCEKATNKTNRDEKKRRHSNHIHHNHKVNKTNEDIVDDSQFIGKLKKKKNKKKQKKNRKHRKFNSYSTTSSASPSTDYDKYDVLRKFFYIKSLEDKLRQLTVDKLPADTTDDNSCDCDMMNNNRNDSGEDNSNNKNDNNNNNNNFDDFSELKDIKFHLSSEQEEDIKKFIQDLNSPPKVFTFDVDKYIKPSQNYIYDMNIGNNFQQQQQIEEKSTKQFYEFPEMLLIDQNEKKKNPSHDTFSTSIYDDDNNGINIPTENNYNNKHHCNRHLNNIIPIPLKNRHHNNDKLDLLRQYIKGRTSYLRNHNSIDDDYNSKVDDGTLYSLYNNPIETIKYDYDNNAQTITTKNSNTDDELIDNYYMLNDGKAEINFPESSKLMKSTKTKYNPVNINCDLELDKKFRELENFHRDLVRDHNDQYNNYSINDIYDMIKNDENDIKNFKDFDYNDYDADADNNKNNNIEKSESDENIEEENLDDKKRKYEFGISVETPFIFPFH